MIFNPCWHSPVIMGAPGKTIDRFGRSWQPPCVVPMPVPGAAEAPAPLCVTRDERWFGCYSPYHTFDPELSVDRSRVIVLASDDQGQTWKNSDMLRFPQPRSGGAEAWVIQLSNGRLLGAGWHLHLDDQQDYPNRYALSDDGLHWGPTRCTGIIGQSVGLAALPNGYALMAFNQPNADRRLAGAGPVYRRRLRSAGEPDRLESRGRHTR